MFLKRLQSCEMWLSSSVFSIFALCSPERCCTACTRCHSIAPWQLPLLTELPGQNTLAKEQQNPMACASSSERSSLLTLLVCVLTLPCLLCLLAFGNLLQGQRAKLLSLEAWTHPQWRTESPVLGTQCQNHMVIFHYSPYPMSFQWQSKCLLFKPSNLTIQGINVDMKL